MMSYCIIQVIVGYCVIVPITSSLSSILGPAAVKHEEESAATTLHTGNGACEV